MKIFDAINKQMNFELESAYIYKSMAAWLNDQEMPGMEHFMNEQAKEEIEHAESMRKLLQDVGYAVKYEPINPGDGQYKSILDVFQSALEHEKLVTENIHKLVRLAREQDELRAMTLLQHFVDEQVEEEATFNALVTRLERAKDNWGALYILDGELGSR